MTLQKALFLDRDGVINQDKGYVSRFEDIIWIEETFSIIKLAHERNYKVIILTNQSGIHKGMYKKSDVELLHKQMNDFMTAKGVIVDDWFYCAEIDSPYRKPRPGMLLEAQKKHNIDLEASFMVGDKASDIFLTDGSFVRPVTYIIQGNYDLKEVTESSRVKVFSTHLAILKELQIRL